MYCVFRCLKPEISDMVKHREVLESSHLNIKKIGKVRRRENTDINVHLEERITRDAHVTKSRMIHLKMLVR